MKDRPLFIKSFISFVILLFVLVFVIGAIFNYSIIKYSENEISKASIGKLRVIYTIYDMMVENVSREALRLSLDKYLNTMYYGYKNPDKLDNLNGTTNIRNIIDVLDEMVNSNPGISSIYVYIEDSGFIISSNSGVGYVNDFHDTGWLKQYKESKEKGIKATWLRTRIPVNEDLLWDKSRLSLLNLDKNPVISYIFPLSIYTTPVNGAIIVNVNEERFARLINNENNTSAGKIFIIDSKGFVITHPDKNLVGSDISEEESIHKIIDSNLPEGSIITNTGEGSQLVTYSKSEINDWIYVGVFSLNTLLDKMNSLRIQVAGILLVLVILGFVVSYFVSKKLYNPVNKLLQAIKSNKDFDIPDSKNEVTALSKAFDSLIRQEKNLNSLLEKNKGNIKARYLMDLANGLPHESDVNNLIHIDFTLPHFVCAVLCIDRYRAFTTMFPEDQRQYIKTILASICEEIPVLPFKCYSTPLEREKILLVINMDATDEQKTILQLTEYFGEIQREVGKILENTISVGIGNIYNNLDGLKFSYLEASEVLGKRFISGYGSILDWKQESLDAHGIYHYHSNNEKLILNNLNNGSREGIASAVSEFIKDIKGNKGISMDNVWLIFFQLLGRILEYLLNHNISVGSVFGENYNIYRRLSALETIDEVENWLVETLHAIISYNDSREMDDKKYVDRALKYIHQNYKKDIDVISVAQQIGVSYSQLRRVFVNELGVNLVNYVNNLRIEEAKRLLHETDASVVDIALSLGYNNDQSFNRFFKKFEGITPGEFRNKSR